MPRKDSEQDMARAEIKTPAQCEHARQFIRFARKMDAGYKPGRKAQMYLYWPILDALRGGLPLRGPEVSKCVRERRNWGEGIKFNVPGAGRRHPSVVGIAGTSLKREGLIRQDGSGWMIREGKAQEIIKEVADAGGDAESQGGHAEQFVRFAKNLYEGYELHRNAQMYFYWPILDELRKGQPLTGSEVARRIEAMRQWGEKVRFSGLTMGLAGTTLKEEGLLVKGGRAGWTLTADAEEILREIQ